VTPALSRRALLLGRPLTGAFRIDPTRCLPFCTVCAERCPVPGAIVLETGRPRIIPWRCTACGDCERVCPAPGPHRPLDSPE